MHVSPSGASRQDYRFRAKYAGHDRALILRRDPPASLIETERSTEFRAYRRYWARSAVPEPIALELDGKALEQPFFIMEEVENCSMLPSSRPIRMARIA